MDERTVEKTKAAAQIGFGVARGVGGVMTLLGHGIVGTILRNGHAMRMAPRIARLQFDGAKHSIEAGKKRWDAADRL